MVKDPFKDARKEIDRMRTDHRRAIDEALEQIQAAIAFAQAEMRTARIDFTTNMERVRRRIEAIARDEEKRRRRRPRRDPGGELEPVEPKPKPNLLSGGAEAPIE